MKLTASLRLKHKFQLRPFPPHQLNWIYHRRLFAHGNWLQVNNMPANCQSERDGARHDSELCEKKRDGKSARVWLQVERASWRWGRCGLGRCFWELLFKFWGRIWSFLCGVILQVTFSLIYNKKYVSAIFRSKYSEQLAV